LAETKAEAVARRHPGHWVLAADTTVVVDGKLLGKPSSPREAARMLRLLSGRSHRVVSALALARLRDRFLRSAVSTTRVFFQKLTADEIRWYVASGEPMDKAGAYAIQGLGGLLVTRIEGSFSNVVGFPLEQFFELWRRAGLALPGASQRREGLQFKAASWAPREPKRRRLTEPFSMRSRRKSERASPR
jgi:septum formation protein